MKKCTKLALGRTVALLALWILFTCSLNLDISSFDNDTWNGKGAHAALCWWNGITDTAGVAMPDHSYFLILYVEERNTGYVQSFLRSFCSF